MSKNLLFSSMNHFLKVTCWIILLTSTIIGGFSQDAQAQTDVFNGAKTALKVGNSKELARHFNSNIELIIESENVEFDKVSSTQAELVLKNFFQKNPAKDFTYVHQGSSPEGAQYSTGTYQSQSGSFLVYIVLKQFGGRYLIDRIDFRKE